VGSSKEIMLKSYEYGKYGRVIGELFIVSGSRKQSINKMMLAEGLVTEYDGGAR
jgi:endonuclease YncB( thermonuclease family)